MPAWHAAGCRGQGVKVAVLDTGFRGYRDFLGKALPAKVTARSFRADGNLEARDSQHGILCGEVIHALAPDAELLFANWDGDRPEQFLDAVRWAREQGARVVTCSVITPTLERRRGGRPGPRAACRGCSARTCSASPAPATRPSATGAGTSATAATAGTNGRPAEGTTSVQPFGGEPVSVELCWPRGADYELDVWDATTGREVGQSAAATGRRADLGRGAASGRKSRHSYRVRVRRVAGHDTGRFHLVALGGGLEVATARGSIPFPGDGPEVIAVGAVADDGRRAPYSSCGPNSTAPKPDLVAAGAVPEPGRGSGRSPARRPRPPRRRRWRRCSGRAAPTGAPTAFTKRWSARPATCSPPATTTKPDTDRSPCPLSSDRDGEGGEPAPLRGRVSFHRSA